jgi:hypothetical protein
VRRRGSCDIATYNVWKWRRLAGKNIVKGGEWRLLEMADLNIAHLGNCGRIEGMEFGVRRRDRTECL